MKGIHLSVLPWLLIISLVFNGVFVFTVYQSVVQARQININTLMAIEECLYEFQMHYIRYIQEPTGDKAFILNLINEKLSALLQSLNDNWYIHEQERRLIQALHTFNGDIFQFTPWRIWGAELTDDMKHHIAAFTEYLTTVDEAMRQNFGRRRGDYFLDRRAAAEAMEQAREAFLKRMYGQTSQTDDELSPAQSDANIKFMALDSSRLQPEDFEKAYEMCERFLRESYYARKNPSNIDLSSYIIDPNLLKYAVKKVEMEIRQSYAKIDISLAKSEYQGDRFFLLLIAQVSTAYGGRFGEGTQLLVKNSGGRLVIADWFTEKGRSAFDRHRDPQRITNPTVWEDPEQVKVLFEKVGIQ